MSGQVEARAQQERRPWPVEVAVLAQVRIYPAYEVVQVIPAVNLEPMSSLPAFQAQPPRQLPALELERWLSQRLAAE